MDHEHEDWQEPPNEDDDLGDIPEFVEDIELIEEPPSPEKAAEFFSNQKNVEELLQEIDKTQRATVMGKAAEERAKEIYAQEEERKRSQHRTRLSIEEFDSNTRSWKERKDDD